MLLSHHSICGRNINNSDFCAHLMELNGLCSVEKIVIGLCFLTFSVGVCVCVRERHRERLFLQNLEGSDVYFRFIHSMECTDHCRKLMFCVLFRAQK